MLFDNGIDGGYQGRDAPDSQDVVEINLPERVGEEVLYRLNNIGKSQGADCGCDDAERAANQLADQRSKVSPFNPREAVVDKLPDGLSDFTRIQVLYLFPHGCDERVQALGDSVRQPFPVKLRDRRVEEAQNARKEKGEETPDSIPLDGSDCRVQTDDNRPRRLREVKLL